MTDSLKGAAGERGLCAGQPDGGLAGGSLAGGHSSLKIEVPGGARRVLLHSCCAPCCGAITECLQENGIEPVIFFSNSNIWPRGEYELRRDECGRWAAARGVVFVEDEYDHAAWREAVLGLEGEPERGRRCSACFRFRLLRAARYAAASGFTVLTTSLASSRWKNLEQVNAAGEEACAAAASGTAGSALNRISSCAASGAPTIAPEGITLRKTSFDTVADSPAIAPAQPPVWWPQNWRKGGLQERRSQIIREQNFYNQNYCGCEFSLSAQNSCRREMPIPPTAANPSAPEIP